MSFVKMDSGQKDPKILSSILTRLISLGLITNDEKLKMGGRGRSNDTKIDLFDMLMEKDGLAASKMFLAIRAVKFENEESSNFGKIIRNPLQNTVAIKKVLGFLNFKDVKNCRLINKTWNSVAGPLITKQSLIIFRSEVDEDNIEPIRSPAKFFETYAGSFVTQSFDSFRFERRMDLHLSDLKNFFAQQKKNIKKLYFIFVKLIDEKGQVLENYDISDLLVGSPLTKILCIYCNPTTLTLSLDRLHSVSEIKLYKCVIKVPSSKGCRISPFSFDIWDVTWQLENGANINKVRLHDFIDFCKAKDITIISSRRSKLIFDISQCLHLEYLSLSGEVMVINWDKAKPTIESFVMDGIPFLEKTEMKIKKLRFQNSSIDLFALPWAIENLDLEGRGGELNVLCSQPITLPNLKSISCIIQPELLSIFANCANLVDINFSGHADEDTILTTNWVWKRVERIKMDKVKVIGPILNLETLVLSCSLNDADEILKIIKPKVLVLNWLRKFEANDSVLEFLKQFKNLILYMGPFNWDEDLQPKYEYSKLATCVDKKATHYVFKNNLGKAIEYKEFNGLYRH